jgi:Ca-activated chloride channel family protein
MGPTIDTDVNRGAVPPSGTTLTAEVDVQPGEKDTAVERHIALCIDTSGSMGGAKIERARDGASWIFGLLEPDDFVTVIAFDSDAEVALQPTRWREIDREVAMQCVEQLGAGGGTDMYEGLVRSKEALESIGYRAEAGNPVRRLLLLSDGKDKSHDPPDFERLAGEVDETGIRIESAGIGSDYNEETIRRLGTTARGKWTHLDSPGDIEDFFGEAVEHAKDVVAPDAQLELDVAPGVEVSEVYRALPQAQDVDLDWAANTAVVKLPDLAERERQQVVMKVHAPGREVTGDETVGLLDVTLSARGGRATDQVAVEYTEDNAKLAEHNEDVQLNHQQTVIKTELGKGNVDEAETQVERMTRIHGEDTEVVKEAERETQIVKEGGRAERNRATKIVDDEGLQK